MFSSSLPSPSLKLSCLSGMKEEEDGMGDRIVVRDDMGVILFD